MTGTAGRSEFFAREASEYLGELDALLGGSAAPQAEAFVRLARALRGAAMLAGPAALARSASQLEDVAKQIHHGALAWSGLEGPLREAMAEFRRLVGFARSWDEARDREAGALQARLQDLAAHATEPPPSHPPQKQADGLRAFVAREAAAVAGTLDAAAPSLRAGSPPPESLAGIEHAMQSLRGLAGLAELAPLGDLLDAVDAAVADLRRFPVVPVGADRLARAGAAVFGRMATDIAERGQPSEDATDVDQFATLLYRTLVVGNGVIPIEQLVGGNGAGSPSVGARPQRRATGMDLASLGERLRQGAAQMRAARSAAARRLQGFVLLQAVRAAPGGLGHDPAAEFLTPLVRHLETGPVEDTALLAELLDRAGSRLVEQAADPGGLREVLRRLASSLPVPGAARPVVPIESLAPVPDVVPIESLAPEPEVVPIESLAPEPDVVPIESLAPDLEVVPIESLAPEPDVVPIESLAPDLEVVPIEALAPDEDVMAIELLLATTTIGPIDALLAESALSPVASPAQPAGRTMLERSLSHYSQLVHSRAPVLPLERLAAPAISPARGSHSAALEIEAELGAVPIEQLLYSGKAALDRADLVRGELEIALRAASDELDRVEPLVRELLDLVPLAFASPH